MTNEREWYVVIKYANADYLGEQVDAHYVDRADQALRLASLGPMRPGERLRGFWCQNDSQREMARRLRDKRLKADQEWSELMEQVENAWLRAQHGVV